MVEFTVGAPSVPIRTTGYLPPENRGPVSSKLDSELLELFCFLNPSLYPKKEPD